MFSSYKCIIMSRAVGPNISNVLSNRCNRVSAASAKEVQRTTSGMDWRTETDCLIVILGRDNANLNLPVTDGKEFLETIAKTAELNLGVFLGNFYVTMECKSTKVNFLFTFIYHHIEFASVRSIRVDIWEFAMEGSPVFNEVRRYRDRLMSRPWIFPDSGNPVTEECPDTDSDPAMKDPYCDGDNPVIVTGEDIILAQEKIKEGIVRTPCRRTRMSEALGAEVYFKKEFMQYTGSFKDRGALLALLSLTDEQKQRGVVTTSAGNHAQAMAFQGGKLGIPVTVVMPKTAPLVKVTSCRDLKAEVILHGSRFDEAKAHAMKLRNERNLVYIDGYDHPDILAGQGTAGLEILEDIPDVDYVIVPVGGGGLIAGVSAAIKHMKPDVKIIGIESDRCPSWHTAMENGSPIPCRRTMRGAKQSVADGLNVVRVGYNAFATAKIDRMVAVPEKYISIAILRLLEGEKSVVEGAGAIGLAALLSGLLPEVVGKKVVCILCGGNIDATVLGLVIDRALVQEGRLCRFMVVVSDRPGGLARLVNLLAHMAASVKDIGHDRISLSSYVYMTGISCTIETRNQAHADEIRSKLFEAYGEDLKWQEDADDEDD